MCAMEMPDNAERCPSCGTRPADGFSAPFRNRDNQELSFRSGDLALSPAPMEIPPKTNPSVMAGQEEPASTASNSGELTGTTVAERFLIAELIGEGGMGQVYKATHLMLGKPVCVKILRPQVATDATMVVRFEPRRGQPVDSTTPTPFRFLILDTSLAAASTWQWSSSRARTWQGRSPKNGRCPNRASVTSSRRCSGALCRSCRPSHSPRFEA